MKALIWNKNKIELTEREYPALQDSRDAIVKVKLSSICTSDLHIIKGFVPNAKEGTVLGHEFVGEIVELGDGVKNLKVGDRVSANCETFCGECYFCRHGFINNCEKGGWKLGCSIDGCQAEYVRVPFADCGLTKIPDNVTYENALFVGDILSSGYFGVELCELKAGETLAVIGAGPVGLCSMACAKLFSPSKIIAIDTDKFRLDLAKRLGLADYTLNPAECDIEKEVKSLTKTRGADKVIDAGGGRGKCNEPDSRTTSLESTGLEGEATGLAFKSIDYATQTGSFEMAWRIARPNAIIALVAMYEEDQILPLPKMYGKNLIFKTGGVDAVHCRELLNLISEGKLNTDFLITHKFPLADILEAYNTFENKSDNCLKIAVTY